jgi:hypothetical protein
MKTVYLDNNCYRRLLDDRDTYALLLSLSDKRRRLLSFESGPGTLEEFALLRDAPRREPQCRQMLGDATRLIRKDRFFRGHIELADQEASIAMGNQKRLSLWFGRRSREVRLWRLYWKEVCGGRPSREFLETIQRAKDEYVATFEPAREEALEEARKKQYDTDHRAGLIDAICYVSTHSALDFAARIAGDRWVVLPDSHDDRRIIVARDLHSLRTFMGVLAGFMLARESACSKQIDPGRSMKGQGKHVGSEFHDVRHAVCGRYVDRFVSEDAILRLIVNSLGETTSTGAPYKAYSLDEFVIEARSLAGL